MIAFLLIAYFVTGALVVMLIIAVFNAWRFPRLAAGNLNPEARVSLLIPARNEAGIIGSSLRMLQKQDDPGLEILVLDDNSTDDTAEAVRAAAEEDGRIRLLIGAPLPPGRLGKPWACHQLSRAATGDILIFTDADVGWQPRSINAVVQIMNASGADLLSVWPKLPEVGPNASPCRSWPWPYWPTCPCPWSVTTACGRPPRPMVNAWPSAGKHMTLAAVMQQ